LRKEEERLRQEKALRERIAEWDGSSEIPWNQAMLQCSKNAADFRVPITSAYPDEPLCEILRKLVESVPLSQLELQLLADSGAPRLASNYEEIQICEVRFAQSQNPQTLARISGLWRRCQRPDLALAAVSRFLDPDFRPVVALSSDEATLLNTCGGGLRDMNRLEEARRCAERAVQLRPGHSYAYCLLGAIHVQSGDLDVTVQS
jgi:hypothetical protein